MWGSGVVGILPWLGCRWAFRLQKGGTGRWLQCPDLSSGAVYLGYLYLEPVFPGEEQPGAGHRLSGET